jgi:hypothetical protein
MMETIEHLGSPIPKDVVTGGSATGAVVYSPESGFRGQLKLDAVTLRLPGKAAAHIEQARLIAAGDILELPAATLRFDNASTLVDGSYDRVARALNARFSARALPIATLKSALGATVPAPFSGLLETASEGMCSGALRLEQSGDAPGEWSAEADVRDTKINLPALSEPARVSAAHVSVSGARFALSQIDAEVGGMLLGGEAAFHPDAARPYRLNLTSREVDAGKVETLLAPALHPRQGFLQRTLHIGRPAPPHWLDDWRAEGVIEAGTLMVNELAFKNARLSFTWDAAELEAKPVSAVFEDGALSGTLSASLGPAAPRYKFSGRVDDLRWSGGTSTIEGVAEASGTGAALLKSLRMKGSVRGQSLTLLADKDLRAFAGRCDVNWNAGTPEFRFTDLLVRLPQEELKGSGGTTKEGKLQFDLSGEGARYQLRGEVSPLKLELLPQP